MCKAKSIVVRELCDHEFCDTIIPRHIRGGVVDFIKWDSGETLGASPQSSPRDACRVERRNPAERRSVRDFVHKRTLRAGRARASTRLLS